MQSGISPETHAHVVDVDPRPMKALDLQAEAALICKASIPRQALMAGAASMKHRWILQQSVFAPNLILHDTVKTVNRAFLKDWDLMIAASVKYQNKTRLTGVWSDFIRTPTQQQQL